MIGNAHAPVTRGIVSEEYYITFFECRCMLTLGVSLALFGTSETLKFFYFGYFCCRLVQLLKI